MYNDTVTVFNRKHNGETDYWCPTIMHNVHLNMDRAAILAKYGENSSDSALLNVRYKTENNERKIEGKKWLPPKEWRKMEDPSGFITFQSGDTFDFFVIGEWTGKNAVNNDEYADVGGFYNYMNREYDYVFAITAVGGPYTVIPHFEILGR